MKDFIKMTARDLTGNSLSMPMARYGAAHMLDTWRQTFPGEEPRGEFSDATIYMTAHGIERQGTDMFEAACHLFDMQWAQFGFPTFELTHGLAAALAMTDMRGVRGLRLPYNTFMLSLPRPSPLLIGGKDVIRIAVMSYRAFGDHMPPEFLDESNASALEMQRLLSTQREEDRVRALRVAREFQDRAAAASNIQYAILIVDENGIGTFDNYVRLPDDAPIEAWLRMVNDKFDAHPGFISDRDATLTGWRFVAAVCSYIESLPALTPTNRRKPQTRPWRPSDGPPAPLHFVLGREIKLSKELREAARASCSSKTRALYRLHARFTVRGHFRNQVCGKGRAERRKTWIAPYWKGPNTAEGLMRLYAVTEPSLEPK